MTILVTGGCGFIGTHVVKRLLDGGRTVVVLDSAPRRDTLSRVLGPERASTVDVRAVDLRERGALDDVVRECSIDRIVHLAAALNAVCNADPPLGVAVNIGGLVNVLEVARARRVRRVVWASTGGVYGGSSSSAPHANDAPYAPRGLYAATKAFGESLARHYFDAFGVDSIALRFPFVTGVGIGSSLTGGLLRELVEKPARGEAGRVPYGLDHLNALSVGDAARAVLLALDVPATRSRAFNLGGDTRTVAELAGIVRELVPGAQITLEPMRYGFSGEVDASAAEAELGFRAAVTWPDQLRDLVNGARAAAR